MAQSDGKTVKLKGPGICARGVEAVKLVRCAKMENFWARESGNLQTSRYHRADLRIYRSTN